MGPARRGRRSLATPSICIPPWAGGTAAIVAGARPPSLVVVLELTPAGNTQQTVATGFEQNPENPT